MEFTRTPQLNSGRRVFLAALAVSSLVVLGLLRYAGESLANLGDTDDAMRLVLVRQLMSGTGWYDQFITRLQPPQGVFLHWSRLVDGLLAGFTKLLELALPSEAAETAMRIAWPLLLILPAVFCALLIARRLGGSLAPFICGILFASNPQAFLQFMPGRIDHHNIQILMTMIAAACALSEQKQARWAIGAGTSTAFGLAVGIEALPFQVVIAAGYALRAILQGDKSGAARNYALALLVSTLFFFCLQTPPWRWFMPFCDAIGSNLVAAICVGSCGLILMTRATDRFSLYGRWIMLLGLLLATALVYFAMDPACLKGPLGAIDPRIRPFWFDLVDELQPLPVIMRRYYTLGISLVGLIVIGLIAGGVLLAKEWPKPRFDTLLAVTLMLMAIALGYLAGRMLNYVFWLGFPVIAAAFATISSRFLGERMLPTALIAIALSPFGIRVMVPLGLSPFNAHTADPPASAITSCHDSSAYRELARQRPGLVLADISLGPFILANTQDSVLNAPYHRMSWGILKSHEILSSPDRQAEVEIRAQKIDYIVTCTFTARMPVKGSIEAELREGHIPEWLQTRSSKGQTLQIYGVRAVPSPTADIRATGQAPAR
jgi:hypothetical protein